MTGTTWSRAGRRALLGLAVLGAVGIAPSPSGRGIPHTGRFSSPRSSPSRPDTVASPARASSFVYVTVTVDITFEPATHYYVYTYTVTNDYDSQNSLEAFAITPALDVKSIQSPQHWSSFRGYQGDPLSVVWTVTDNVDYWPPGWDGISVPESPYNPRPGQTTTGFVIKSPFSPISVTYYAQGFEPMVDESQVSDEEAELGEDATIYQAGATGTILGPNQNITVGTSDSTVKPALQRFELQPPAPNPSRDVVRVGVALPRAESVSLVIHDVGGRVVRTLVSGTLDRGLRSFVWDGTNDSEQRVAAGVYFYALRVGGRAIAERRVVLMQ